MKRTNLTPENTIFVVLSFEGPDGYSLAGGLGVRVTNLCRTLAKEGFPTHLFFIGDPRGQGEEMTNGGRLWLHRWCQWISEYYPVGVYQGENEKLYDFNESIPHFVTEHIIRPAVANGKIVAVLGEEWHTAEVMCRLSDLLYSRGLRDNVVMFWNANNTFSFERIDWKRLKVASTITTVSRYMKHIIWRLGVNPLVIPNGIPRALLNRIDEMESTRLRASLNADLVLTKVARWDPDKRWNSAVEAAARLKEKGLKTVLLARGGLESHGAEVMENAHALGLKVKDIPDGGDSLDDYLNALESGKGADILNLKFHCPQDFLRLIYNASDAVLANSSHEPFGLVGLESMAARGVAFTGGTGEDYAIPFHNSIVLETSDPREIEAYVLYLKKYPEEEERIRKAAWATARRFAWEEVIQNLIRKLEYQARVQESLAPGG
ncbi:MAG: glycosyltransferase family 4 protein [Dehalococcoidales bacterium]|nr:glycosyltransferase family 4 protein [Dehalococcoidales bacterium]